MHAYSASSFALRVSASVASLTLVFGAACQAQDVIYVDDFNSPAAQQAGPVLPSLSRPRTQPMAQPPVARDVLVNRRGPTRQQVSQALGEQAKQIEAKQQKTSPLGRLSAGFKNLFARDKDDSPSAGHSFASDLPAKPSGKPSAQGVQQAAYDYPNGSRQTARATVSPTTNSNRGRNGGIAIRTGDQRRGLFDMNSSSDSTRKSPSKPQPMQGRPTGSLSKVDNTPRPISSGRSDSPTASRQWDSQSSGPASGSSPLSIQASSESSDNAVFVSDLTAGPSKQGVEPATQYPRPIQAKPTASLPRPIIASASPMQSSEPFRASPSASSQGPRPMVVENPLVVENPMADAEPLAKTQAYQTPAPTKQAPRKLAAAAPMPQQRIAQTPQQKPSPVMLPNPVEVVEQKTPQTTERAAALLAAAHAQAENAQTEQELTHIVQQCRHVMAIDDSPVAMQYSNDLAAWALNKRGELKADAGREDEAMADFEEAVSKDPGRWRAVHNRGVLMAQSGRFSEAFDAFNNTIELNPEFAKAYSNRASLYVQAGDFEVALKDYKQAIMLDPDLVVAHKGRGRVCHVLGQLEQSLRHFEAAVLLSPNDATIATCRADLLVDMGRYPQAGMGYQRAIEIDPTEATAYRNLAWMQATCPEDSYRNPQQALANAQKAIELSGAEDDIALDTLAAAQAASGDFPGAVETIKQAITLAPAADQVEYAERLELYLASRAFQSDPSGVRQAGYAEASD